MENQSRSAYVDWFFIRGFPVDAYGDHQYETYSKMRRMPKLNLSNPAARQYFLDVARYWIAQGADGWRLDAAEEVEDSGFWREFRKAIKEVNPEAYIFGEIWKDGGPWLEGDQFDGTTNYGLRGVLLDFFVYHTIRAAEFCRRLEDLLSRHPQSAVEGMYNLLGSHDTRARAHACRGQHEQGCTGSAVPLHPARRSVDILWGRDWLAGRRGPR